MADKQITLDEDFVERVRELSRYVEEGNEAEADRVLDQIAKLRESSLFQELGKLTRQFHEALNNFRLDSRITRFAEKEFPDARERLRHVVDMTAKSADRSLTATEESMPICDNIQQQAEQFKAQWQRFTQREMSADEFRQLSVELNDFFDELGRGSTQLRTNLNEVVMAQDFQDLTGQIIERVITLVDEMEDSLVELIRISGQDLVPNEAPGEKRKEPEQDKLKGTGPTIPGVDDAQEVVSGQDEVDDLLSSLGF
ncbi:MAG: protein phosphatase CheZ [Pseudomonadota bacterium]